MERIDRIVNHPVFRREVDALHTLEADRIFCGHEMGHLLDVARLMWIFRLEEGQSVSKELVYAAALLHDIGRAEQYRSGTHHAKAGAELSEVILCECGFSGEEIDQIRTAILGHSGAGSSMTPLGRLLYRADKQSRPCYACPAAAECNWPVEKKNVSLEY